MTGRSKYAEELLAGLESPERLLSLWAEGDALLRGHRIPIAALPLRQEVLTMSMKTAVFIHETVSKAEALLGGVDSPDDAPR